MGLSAEKLLAFLSACLCVNPDDRITAAALLEDESVGQDWFGLAGTTLDIRTRGMLLLYLIRLQLLLESASLALSFQSSLCSE